MWARLLILVTHQNLGEAQIYGPHQQSRACNQHLCGTIFAGDFRYRCAGYNAVVGLSHLYSSSVEYLKKTVYRKVNRPVVPRSWWHVSSFSSSNILNVQLC